MHSVCSQVLSASARYCQRGSLSLRCAPVASAVRFDASRFQSTRLASTQSSHESVDKIFELFADAGSEDYVGELISQEEHALQGADLAMRANFGEDVVIAALLHDCGHLLGVKDTTLPRMGDCGIADHENLGGQWLRDLGFSERVATLVARHVDAKRYLCCVNPEYKLSDASRTTLMHQGGQMTPEEAKAFEEDKNFKIILAMRRWDEAAKVPNKKVPGLESYRSMLLRNFEAPASE